MAQFHGYPGWIGGWPFELWRPYWANFGGSVHDHCHVSDDLCLGNFPLAGAKYTAAWTEWVRRPIRTECFGAGLVGGSGGQLYSSDPGGSVVSLKHI